MNKKQKELELELLNACLRNDPLAYEKFYDYFAPKMFAICLRYASGYHMAEDHLQEGFIKVFRNLKKYRGDGSFEGWVRRIFVNTAIEQYRKANSSYRFLELENIINKPTNENIISQLSANDLLNLVQKLPDGYRLVFNLYCIEGYSHKEIAEKLKVKIGTSKSQLARARIYIQKLLEDQIENEESNIRRIRPAIPGLST